MGEGTRLKGSNALSKEIRKGNEALATGLFSFICLMDGNARVGCFPILFDCFIVCNFELNALEV
jgi:hypothetical protein